MEEIKDTNIIIGKNLLTLRKSKKLQKFISTSVMVLLKFIRTIPNLKSVSSHMPLSIRIYVIKQRMTSKAVCDSRSISTESAFA